ncbi:MAG: M20/M25/M40 family metallo-hydrolase [Desulfuromonadaceae bacterium]|nr:M20/M25/M40 family metallo-hydrolase [Desulfuromonas sp.]MDY0184825.1 M20/M25/M40 family metallo-hydrolase [Desulfuromonadaceae bacterium]
MINIDRLCEEFRALATIDSPSFYEGNIATYLCKRLEELGAEVEVDSSAGATGSESGNIIARIPAYRHSGATLLLSAHMDTVSPAIGVIPVLKDGVFTSAGDTVLGADDKSGIAQILEVVQVLRENEIPHPALELIFTVCEEVGLLGAKHLDYSKLQARHGLALDTSGVGTVARYAPCSNKLKFSIHGRAAHAGLAPEYGISAVRIAARAIEQMQLGRIDADTTANIGIIHGGQATNIVPDKVEMLGEVRSFSQSGLEQQTAHMCAVLQAAAQHYARFATDDSDDAAFTPTVECEVLADYPLMQVAADAPLLHYLTQAAQRLGQKLEVGRSGGGSDANIFNANGIVTLNLATGMNKVHSTAEYIKVADLESVARLVLECIRSIP